LSFQNIDKNALLKTINEAKKQKGNKNFTQSLDLIITTHGLNLKKPENRIRCVIKLPNSIGNEKKIIVFADSNINDSAKSAGADKVMNNSEIDSLAGNKKEGKKLVGNYDFFLSEPKMIKKVGQILGFAMGPKGKSPQVITPTTDIKKMISELKNSVNIYLKTRPEISSKIGDETMESETLAENAHTFISTFNQELGEKGRIANICFKTTMGKTVKVK